MKNYQNNMADQDLVVHSLKVLTDVNGGGFDEVKRNVEAVKQSMGMQIKQQEEYWKALSDDGIVSTVEKQSLRREMENIRQSFSAITSQAESFGYSNPLLQGYIDTYNALRAYLYDTLKLFDDMERDSVIDSRDTFNNYFSNYFFMENFILLAITKGVLDTLEFRVLSSLNEPGEEGETGIYKGALYQYVDGVWKNVTTGAYKGAQSELPGTEENSFFLASETFTMSDVLIVNDEELLVNNDTLLITHLYIKGYIYYCQKGVWYAVTDKTNWRYAAAFADVINITGELPQIFQDGLDNLQEQVTALEGQYTIIAGDIVQVTEDLEAQGYRLNELPLYLGASSTIPQNPKEGDFFLYTGADSTSTSPQWYFANIYRRTNGAWQRLYSTDAQYKSYYMMALQDILAVTETSTGYFNTAFANSFFTNTGVMEELSVRTIYLRSGGYIMSDISQYSQESRGLRIDAAGNLDANQNTHIKGKVAIGVPLTGNSDFSTYDIVVGGNALIAGTAKIKGAIDTDKECFAAGFELRGLKPGKISLRKMNAENAKVSWMIPASGTISFHGTVSIAHRGGRLSVLVNGVQKYEWVLEDAILSPDMQYFRINNNYYFDLEVNAGDTITVYAQGLGVQQSGIVTFLGGLYSATRNSLVTFLGQTVYEVNPPSPVR